LVVVKHRQVVEAVGHVGVLRTQSLVSDRQRPLVKGLGLHVFTLLVVKHRQVVEAHGHVGVFRTQSLFPERQRPLVKGLGVGITTTLTQIETNLVEQSGRLGKLEAPLVNKFRAGVRLREKPVADSPVRKLYVWKCAGYGSHSPFRP
jgi:hypothetical protein